MCYLLIIGISWDSCLLKRLRWTKTVSIDVSSCWGSCHKITVIIRQQNHLTIYLRMTWLVSRFYTIRNAWVTEQCVLLVSAAGCRRRARALRLAWLQESVAVLEQRAAAAHLPHRAAGAEEVLQSSPLRSSPSAPPVRAMSLNATPLLRTLCSLGLLCTRVLCCYVRRMETLQG